MFMVYKLKTTQSSIPLVLVFYSFTNFRLVWFSSYHTLPNLAGCRAFVSILFRVIWRYISEFWFIVFIFSSFYVKSCNIYISYQFCEKHRFALRFHLYFSLYLFPTFWKFHLQVFGSSKLSLCKSRISIPFDL